MKTAGWLVLVGGAIALYLAYWWETNNANLPGAGASAPNNPNLSPGSGVAASIFGKITNFVGQQTQTITGDLDGDAGATPTVSAQTEAAYNQGANSQGIPTGSDENVNDEDGLDSMFSTDNESD